MVEKSNGNKISALLKMANVSMDNQTVICCLTAVVTWDHSLEKVFLE